ncbi:hypothetical protein Nwat_0120 [Nitrosococcus watsonii C-113]|uniref:Uncharacterized protein n=1 Tax=Nitrosococcus watsoni (strain C-113) TaxID=105559 RepID=D8K8A4_NITWC|nr:hypothetical protein Nwat_0120 [Nitrosococcus watsonii C-113]
MFHSNNTLLIEEELFIKIIKFTLRGIVLDVSPDFYAYAIPALVQKLLEH